MLAASSEPSADPAPTSVCSSSMKTMEFWLSINSFMMVLSRSSNWPRYLVPATIRERSSDRMRLSARKRRHIAIGNALRQAFDDGRFADARFADQHGIVLRAAAENLNHALDFALAAHQRIELAFEAACVRSRLNSASSEVSFGRARRRFFARAARPTLRAAWRAQPALHAGFPRQSTFLRAGCRAADARYRRACAQALGFFRGEVQDALALLAERHFDGRGNALADGDARFDLFADGLDRAVLRRKRLASALSSRIRPSSRCSVSMYGLPYWLASYRAKNMTRRAFSV
jgi:hypothetical protein